MIESYETLDRTHLDFPSIGFTSTQQLSALLFIAIINSTNDIYSLLFNDICILLTWKTSQSSESNEYLFQSIANIYKNVITHESQYDFIQSRYTSLCAHAFSHLHKDFVAENLDSIAKFLIRVFKTSFYNV